MTRGTTNPNRLRRCDRWLAGPQAWRWARASRPLVVDLGYGARPVTVLELADRLARIRRDVAVVGIEIDPDRVAQARPLARPGVEFRWGGFEIPLPERRRPHVIRAFNVLRQYDESQVGAAWQLMRERLTPTGIIVDGTCDELGRRATWVAVDRSGPISLTLSVSLRALWRPSDVAERLPKALIHHNVPGEGVHAFLHALDEAWERNAPLSAYGRRQRFIATASDVRQAGWPIADEPRRWRLGEITVAWPAVAPDGAAAS